MKKVSSVHAIRRGDESFSAHVIRSDEYLDFSNHGYLVSRRKEKTKGVQE